MKLWIFNPENDMALADGTPGYTPPANIRRFRMDQWRFPLLWAAPDDYVWDGVSSLHDMTSDVEVCPWGWSPAIVHELVKGGLPRQFMPSDEYLARLRQVSSRVTTSVVQQELGLHVRVCKDVREVEECLLQWGDCFVKTPWSSSGKGVMRVTRLGVRDDGLRIKKMLRQQGAVVVEKTIVGDQDFAMEFCLDGKGGAEYLGLSVFSTDDRGKYLGNIKRSQQELEQLILRYVSSKQLLDVRSFFLQRLPQIFPEYRGYVGVDMLAGTDTFCPCIEINWRMTMGVVAVLRN